ESTHDDRIERRRNSWVNAGRSRDASLCCGRDASPVLVVAERVLPGQAFPQNYANAEDVGASIHDRGLDVLLRRAVEGIATGGVTRAGIKAGDLEIGELHAAFVRDEKSVQRHVAMDDSCSTAVLVSGFVRMVEPLQRAARDVRCELAG